MVKIQCCRILIFWLSFGYCFGYIVLWSIQVLGAHCPPGYVIVLLGGILCPIGAGFTLKGDGSIVFVLVAVKLHKTLCCLCCLSHTRQTAKGGVTQTTQATAQAMSRALPALFPGQIWSLPNELLPCFLLKHASRVQGDSHVRRSQPERWSQP